MYDELDRFASDEIDELVQPLPSVAAPAEPGSGWALFFRMCEGVALGAQVFSIFF